MLLDIKKTLSKKRKNTEGIISETDKRILQEVLLENRELSKQLLSAQERLLKTKEDKIKLLEEKLEKERKKK